MSWKDLTLPRPLTYEGFPRVSYVKSDWLAQEDTETSESDDELPEAAQQVRVLLHAYLSMASWPQGSCKIALRRCVGHTKAHTSVDAFCFGGVRGQWEAQRD